ncbi:MAG: Hsp20/alpha crystallin family protein [Gemmatimonadetes bacterium]|nr:Hsp20/alpha crystallin family protein [Gemmatimonadota bacterium]
MRFREGREETHRILGSPAARGSGRVGARPRSDYRLFERRYGRYQRSFTVPPTVRGDQCEAQYENGVLSVRLPKSEDAKPRRIQVKPGSGDGRRIDPVSAEPRSDGA